MIYSLLDAQVNPTRSECGLGAFLLRLFRVLFRSGLARLYSSAGGLQLNEGLEHVQCEFLLGFKV